MIPSGIPWDFNQVGPVYYSGVSPEFAQKVFDAYDRIKRSLTEPKFQHWSTAKCYDCGKFFKVNGGMLIGGGPSEMCPHCGAKGNI